MIQQFYSIHSQDPSDHYKKIIKYILILEIKNN